MEKQNKKTNQNFANKQENKDYIDRERLSASIALNKKNLTCNISPSVRLICDRIKNLGVQQRYNLKLNRMFFIKL